MGYEFGYGDGERLPSAMRCEDGVVFTLHYDQIGSLRVVADTNGEVIKEIIYDSLGGIIADTNPGLRVPIGFAGGLHDRDLGFVRFGWRDYDTFTGRWTAPDPIGDKGGDPDRYGYCPDDPVNGVDPLGLFGVTTGDVISTGVTVGIEGLKQAGKISPGAAAGLGLLTAPLGDLISPNEAGEGEDYILWKKEAAEKGWLDVFDTEEAIRERERYGKASCE